MPENINSEVTIVSPFIGNINPFQIPIFKKAKAIGYRCLNRCWIPRPLHFFICHLPSAFGITCLQKRGTAQIQLISGTHPEIMLYPYTYRNEIIPIVWDCWPRYVDNMEKIFRRCNIKVAFFTSKQTAILFIHKFPQKHIFYLPEAIDTNLYVKGGLLSKRRIDVLEFGRLYHPMHSQILKIPGLCHVYSKDDTELFPSYEELAKAIADSKISVCYPRSITHPEIAHNIETTTQRYWECMYSGTLIIGKAPQELIEMMGYNPVIETELSDVPILITDILNNIDDYQDLANRNQLFTIQNCDWAIRLGQLEEKLNNLGYKMR